MMIWGFLHPYFWKHPILDHDEITEETHDTPSLKLTTKAPENQWLEDEIPFGRTYSQGLW